VSRGGELYVATGNGSSRKLQDFDEGNSVVELSPSLQRLGFWAPSNWVQLNEADWDLGSAGPVGLPGMALLFAAGKPGTNGSVGYLMKDSPLGGIGAGAFTGPVCLKGGAFGADATDVLRIGKASHVVVYVPCGGGTGFFQDNSGGWWSSFFGNDSQSPFRDKPAIIKVDFAPDGRVIVAAHQPFVPAWKPKPSTS